MGNTHAKNLFMMHQLAWNACFQRLFDVHIQMTSKQHCLLETISTHRCYSVHLTSVTFKWPQNNIIVEDEESL